MKVALLVAGLVLAASAHAQNCIQSGGFVSCSDGSSALIQQNGNTTYTYGNSPSGQPWTMQSNRIGNSTYSTITPPMPMIPPPMFTPPQMEAPQFRGRQICTAQGVCF